jgi:hypothetical protein
VLTLKYFIVLAWYFGAFEGGTSVHLPVGTLMLVSLVLRRA